MALRRRSVAPTSAPTDRGTGCLPPCIATVSARTDRAHTTRRPRVPETALPPPRQTGATASPGRATASANSARTAAWTRAAQSRPHRPRHRLHLRHPLARLRRRALRPENGRTIQTALSTRGAAARTPPSNATSRMQARSRHFVAAFPPVSPATHRSVPRSCFLDSVRACLVCHVSSTPFL